MNKIALAIALLFPFTLSASHHKTANKSKLSTIKEEMDYKKFLEKAAKPKNKKRYKSPALVRPATPPAPGDPFPEIVIEFIAYDEVKK